MSVPSPTPPGTDRPDFAGRPSPFFADTPFGFIHKIVTVVTFLGCWAYAVSIWGWFIGIGLGWIPAAVFATIVAWLFPLAVFLTMIGLLLLFTAAVLFELFGHV